MMINTGRRHTHNEQFTCEHFRDQESCSTRSEVPKEFAAQHAEQARVDQQVGEGRSPCAKELDHSSNAGFVGRLAGGEQGGYKKDNIPKAKAKAASTGSFSMVAAEDFGMEDQSVSSQEMLEKDLEIARLRNMLSQMEKEKDEQQLILSRSKNRKEM